jgi:hypothetical protein
MNKERRKAIDDLIGEIRCLDNKMACLVQELESAVEVILGDEQDAFDNMPESLQYAEKGEAAQEAINSLEYADSVIAGWVSDITDKADEIIGYLEEAKA